ncbi:MAG: hypothetical protein ACREM2_05855 [Vulcanimicrobiaceae bacterium]
MANPPPYITYVVDTHVSAPALRDSRNIARSVAVRTRDGLAVVQDLPRGANALELAFPVSPTFDALSDFTLSWRVGAHQSVTASVHDVKPLTYAAPQSGNYDVVVTHLYQYQASYAPDSSDAPNGKTHIVLQPYDFVTRAVKKPGSTFFLSDLYVDNATGLPSEVIYRGANDVEFLVDYALVEGHWLVDHAHYEETLYGPFRLGRLHVIADAVYHDFAFPSAAPDPRLGN